MLGQAVDTGVVGGVKAYQERIVPEIGQTRENGVQGARPQFGRSATRRGHLGETDLFRGHGADPLSLMAFPARLSGGFNYAL